MNAFFRSLRKQILADNKAKKYLLYGAGEILLVVVGILIALQVNNWNLMQQETQSEKIILEAVVESLEEDSVLFVGIQQELDKIDQIHFEVYQYITESLPSDSIGELQYLRRTVLYNPVTMINHPDLANEVIRRDIKQLVRSYYQKMDDTQYMIDYFNQYVEDFLRPYLGEVQILNYGFQYQQEHTGNTGYTGYTNLIDREAFLDEIEDPAFHQILFEAAVKYVVVRQGLKELQDQNIQMKRKILTYLQE